MGWSTGVTMVSLLKGLATGLAGVVEQAPVAKDTSTTAKRSQTELSDNFLCLRPMN